MLQHKGKWQGYAKFFLITGGVIGLFAVIFVIDSSLKTLLKEEIQTSENWQNCVDRLNEAVHSPTLALAQERVRKGKDECQKTEDSEVLLQNLEAIAKKPDLSELKSGILEQLKNSVPLLYTRFL
jgi:hypothetical protein